MKFNLWGLDEYASVAAGKRKGPISTADTATNFFADEVMTFQHGFIH